jgi:phosphonate transport system ATP-binding protein
VSADRSAVALRGVDFAYRAGRPVLQGIDLDANGGEVTMALGLSGSGKTTLLKLCKGLLAPQRGTVDVLGSRVRPAVGRGRLDPRVAYIPQQLGLVRALSAMENVLTGALARVPLLPSLVQAMPDDIRRRATALLSDMGLAAHADTTVFELSGGERQRVAIARALMQEPSVILADEFISDLDPVTGATIMRIVRDVASRGVAVVMTTHEMDVVRSHADHVVVIKHGRKAMDARATTSADDIVAALA